VPQKPTISVIIPVYNGEKYLSESIESVLKQYYSPLEVVVVDDGSTDESGNIARKYDSVRIVSQANQGIGGARNTGVKNSSGKFIAFLDADDYWPPEKLSLQYQAWKKQNGRPMIFGYAEQFHSSDPGEEVTRPIDPRYKRIAGFVAGTLFIGRDHFLDVGYFDTSLKTGEFIDWYLKAEESGLQSVMLPQTLLHRRVHSGNHGIRQRRFQSEYVRVIKAALDRKRGQQNERSD
jgi:glycosyltransferase involved in cell wall biosynthesis